MKFEEKEEILAEIGDGKIILADGFEEALIGYARQFNETVALYDRAKCIKLLVRRGKTTEEDAEEYFEFNVVGAWVGKTTPAFAVFFKDL